MLKKFRVISNHAINGVAKGEEFEAEWPNDWLTRRMNSRHIEEVPPADDEENEPEEDDFEDVEEPNEEQEEA